MLFTLRSRFDIHFTLRIAFMTKCNITFTLQTAYNTRGGILNCTWTEGWVLLTVRKFLWQNMYLAPVQCERSVKKVISKKVIKKHLKKSTFWNSEPYRFWQWENSLTDRVLCSCRQPLDCPGQRMYQTMQTKHKHMQNIWNTNTNCPGQRRK